MHTLVPVLRANNFFTQIWTWKNRNKEITEQRFGAGGITAFFP
jgi:hypothetical protein